MRALEQESDLAGKQPRSVGLALHFAVRFLRTGYENRAPHKRVADAGRMSKAVACNGMCPAG